MFDIRFSVEANKGPRWHGFQIHKRPGWTHLKSIYIWDPQSRGKRIQTYRAFLPDLTRKIRSPELFFFLPAHIKSDPNPIYFYVSNLWEEPNRGNFRSGLLFAMSRLNRQIRFGRSKKDNAGTNGDMKENESMKKKRVLFESKIDLAITLLLIHLLFYLYNLFAGNLSFIRVEWNQS